MIMFNVLGSIGARYTPGISPGGPIGPRQTNAGPGKKLTKPYTIRIAINRRWLVSERQMAGTAEQVASQAWYGKIPTPSDLQDPNVQKFWQQMLQLLKGKEPTAENFSQTGARVDLGIYNSSTGTQVAAYHNGKKPSLDYVAPYELSGAEGEAVLSGPLFPKDEGTDGSIGARYAPGASYGRAGPAQQQQPSLPAAALSLFGHTGAQGYGVIINKKAMRWPTMPGGGISLSYTLENGTLQLWILIGNKTSSGMMSWTKKKVAMPSGTVDVLIGTKQLSKPGSTIIDTVWVKKSWIVTPDGKGFTQLDYVADYSLSGPEEEAVLSGPLFPNLSGAEEDMFNVYGSIGAIADLVETQGGVQKLTSAANQALAQALASRYPVLTSSASMGAGGMQPGYAPDADYYGFKASLTGSGPNALEQAKTAPVLLVDLVTLDRIIGGDTVDLVYVVAKNMTVATALTQGAGASLAIASVPGAAAAAGAGEEKKPMSTAGKVVVAGLILGGGWLAVKAISKKPMSEAPTVRSY